ncbi:hypothetical protein EYF80_017406 [Liparis tanakae]|uniref:Uncharacterized protein n=1 Tax=Liparis tanakae TaxID=230148 RepID=A0A4Z2I309_9TELE|nr:hypothetical protein EYF80_017406 [Liparis tanakae]
MKQTSGWLHSKCDTFPHVCEEAAATLRTHHPEDPPPRGPTTPRSHHPHGPAGSSPAAVQTGRQARSRVIGQKSKIPREPTLIGQFEAWPVL